MKKEKDAIKNSTKELTKAELVHMFKDAPLSLKFYQLAEAQYNLRIPICRQKYETELETFRKSGLAAVASAEEAYYKDAMRIFSKSTKIGYLKNLWMKHLQS